MYQWDKIKVIGNYDTVVVGGGTAGAAAGIRVEATCAAIIREKTSSPKGCKGDFKIYQDK